MKIKKGDTVTIIAGKDKGKTSTVIRAFPKKEEVLVEGVNVVKKHQRGTRRGQAGQIIERPTPIHISNVALKKGDKAVRVGYTHEGEGREQKKVRVARPSGEKI